MDFIYDLGFIKGRTIPTTIPYEGARIMDYLFTNTARAVDLDAMWRCGHIIEHHSAAHLMCQLPA